MSPLLLREHIFKGAAAQSLSLTNAQVDLLACYVALLAKWNKVYNLTAVRDPFDMVSRHILDSLSLVPFVEGKKLMDVGSGPGLPGIPLAIMYPECAFTCVDSNGKKTRFMMQAKSELGLGNVVVAHERCETFQTKQLFDVIMSRAFSSLHDMVDGTAHLLKPGGQFFAMKGVYPEQELDALFAARSDVSLLASHRLEVSECDAQRHLVILQHEQ